MIEQDVYFQSMFAELGVGALCGMDRREFFLKFSELLELPQAPTANQELSGLGEWDSFAVISFIAMVDESYRLRLVPQEVNGCRTLDELAGLVEKGLKGLPS